MALRFGACTGMAAMAAASQRLAPHRKAEQLHARYRRQFLGVRQSTPAAAAAPWKRVSSRCGCVGCGGQPSSGTACFRRRQTACAPDCGSQLPAASCQQWQRLRSGGPGQLSLRQPWHLSASQPASLLELVPLSLRQLLDAGQERQLVQLLAADAVEGASKSERYVRQVGGLVLVPVAMGRRIRRRRGCGCGGKGWRSCTPAPIGWKRDG